MSDSETDQQAQDIDDSGTESEDSGFEGKHEPVPEMLSTGTALYEDLDQYLDEAWDPKTVGLDYYTEYGHILSDMFHDEMYQLNTGEYGGERGIAADLWESVIGYNPDTSDFDSKQAVYLYYDFTKFFNEIVDSYNKSVGQHGIIAATRKEKRLGKLELMKEIGTDKTERARLISSLLTLRKILKENNYPTGDEMGNYKDPYNPKSGPALGFNTFREWKIDRGKQVKPSVSREKRDKEWMPSVKENLIKKELAERSENRVRNVTESVDRLMKNEEMPVKPHPDPEMVFSEARIFSDTITDDTSEDEKDPGALFQDFDTVDNMMINSLKFPEPITQTMPKLEEHSEKSSSAPYYSVDEVESDIFSDPMIAPSSIEEKEEADAIQNVQNVVQPQQMQNLQYNANVGQFRVKQHNIPRLYNPNTILGGDHVIHSTAYEEIAYKRQAPMLKNYDNRFLNINPTTVFHRQYRESDPISGTSTHMRSKLGDFVHVAGGPRAIHIKILKRRMPDRVFQILASRILEHARSNDVLNVRLLRYIKRGNKRILSMLLNQDQMRTITNDNLERILHKAIKGSNHLVIKQANSGGPIFDRLINDSFL